MKGSLTNILLVRNKTESISSYKSCSFNFTVELETSQETSALALSWHFRRARCSSRVIGSGWLLLLLRRASSFQLLPNFPNQFFKSLPFLCHLLFETRTRDSFSRTYCRSCGSQWNRTNPTRDIHLIVFDTLCLALSPRKLHHIPVQWAR